MSSPFSSEDTSMPKVDERRHSERRPPSFALAIVWVGVRQQIKARVIDESAGGIGLHVPFDTGLEIGFKVRVEQSGKRRWATVRNVTENANGCLRLGLSWDH